MVGTAVNAPGWRLSEIEDLARNQVARDQGIVRLEPGETKNDEGRTAVRVQAKCLNP